MFIFTFGCAAWYALASGSRTASTQTVRLPEAVLTAGAAELAGAAGVLAGAAGVLAGAEAGAAVVLAAADGAGAGVLEAAVVLFFELEQPANANAVTRTGSHRRRCIFTACSLTGSIKNRDRGFVVTKVTAARLRLPSGREATFTSTIGGSRSYV